MKTFLVYTHGGNEPLKIEADSYDLSEDGLYIVFRGREKHPDVLSYAVDHIEEVAARHGAPPTNPPENSAKKSNDSFFTLGVRKFNPEQIDAISNALLKLPAIQSIRYARRGNIHGFIISFTENIDQQVISKVISREVAFAKSRRTTA